MPLKVSLSHRQKTNISVPIIVQPCSHGKRRFWHRPSAQYSCGLQAGVAENPHGYCALGLPAGEISNIEI